MSFITEVIEEFVGDKGERRDEGPVPPSVQWPWVARWDDEARSWIFINEETGERSWERPVMEEVGEFDFVSWNFLGAFRFSFGVFVCFVALYLFSLCTSSYF